MIQAYYANAETSHEMRHRDNCLKETLKAIAVGAGVNKSEFANLYNHVKHYEKMGLFKEGRHSIGNLFRWCSAHHEKAVKYEALNCCAAQSPTRDVL